eukprot:TRINITY_DN48467_c0_g1_i1.p1 TRINITY_DN48467_c0_g1~~TRINITY_DN48467_c0_g1_i1.p1  ORF type:complete len:265 (-),score=108.21 TRINITY_DN48467_c0_g1_i1:438-1232(-)
MNRFPLFLVILALFQYQPFALGEEATSEEPAKENEEEESETKQLLSKLTISMVGEVIDAQTVEIRSTARAGKRQLLRLGNTALPEQGSMSDDKYKAKLEKAKADLEKAVSKQMIWYKEGPKDIQKPSEGKDEIIIGDMWTTDGKHLPSAMVDLGHLTSAKEYEEELATDILQAKAEKERKDQYKALEDALKDTRKEAEQAERAAREEAAKNAPPAPKPAGRYDLAGKMGLLLGGFLIAGVAFLVYKLQESLKPAEKAKKDKKKK